MNEQDFLEHARSLGYGNPQTIELDSKASGPLHTHEFSVIGLVLSGSVTIAFEDKMVSNESGEFCEIPAGVQHDERPGPQGVKVLLVFK